MQTAECVTQAASLLPYDLRRSVESLGSAAARVEELRLRVGQPASVVYPTGEVPLSGCRAVAGEDLRTILELASRSSAHTVLDQLRRGFLTVRGGHRIGICGSAVMKDGEVSNLRGLSSLAIRIAREVRGGAAEVLPRLVSEGRMSSTLILSPPGAGKTTLLRDLIRALSDGDGVPPRRVGVADERGELAGLWDGAAQMEVGRRTDVMDGAPKAQALMLLLRGMNPEVLAADEVTDPADIAAIEQAAGCGVSLLVTAHGGGTVDLNRRGLYRRMMTVGIFERVVTIRVIDGVRRYEVTSVEAR